jgi:hypothetical protein
MFEDVSELIAHNPPARHAGAAVAALDGPRFSVVVAGFGGPNRVLVWSGGQLRDAAPPELADDGRCAVGVAAGDLDGDGREELYVLNADPGSGPKRCSDRLFRRGADGRWEDLFERPENRAVRNAGTGRSAAAIDRRGVGRYGFFVANDGRPARFFELGPGGALADLAPALDLARTTCGRGVLALPVFSPYPDLFCVSEHGANLAFRNRGDGTFEEAAAELHLGDCDEHGRGVTALDAGGTLALAWGNWDGPHRVRVPLPGGTWRERATPGFAFPSAVRTVIAADFDNDGTDELFCHNLGEPNRLYRARVPTERDGGAGCALELSMLEAGAALDPDGYGTGAAVCDVDGDGVLELIVARGEKAAQPLGVFKARAPYPNWLRVRPLTRFGAPARGAVVRAEYGGRVRVKGICGGSGYRCQMEPVAHFGLGDTKTVERVSVTWPDGAGVVLLNPGGNATVTVPYPRG